MSPSAAREPHFRDAFFRFLSDLEKNNNRDWFNGNKKRYLAEVREPAQRFISDFGPLLRQISPHFVADPRPVGGSMFRIYRDVRFSKDKSPYKTYVGIQFRHKHGKDAHCPGFYLGLHIDRVYAGVGIWRPDGATLGRIREAIAERGASWKRIQGSQRFRRHLEPDGDALKRAPRGYPADHPMIDELKRKDFVAMKRFRRREATSPDFLRAYAAACRAGAPMVKFLCEAIDAPF